MLPADINIADYATPEELVYEVTRDLRPAESLRQSARSLQLVGSLEADQQFFGEGKYEGFGFSWRWKTTRCASLASSLTVLPTPGWIWRGQTVVSIDGRPIADILANEGINAALDNATAHSKFEN